MFNGGMGGVVDISWMGLSCVAMEILPEHDNVLVVMNSGLLK